MEQAGRIVSEVKPPDLLRAAMMCARDECPPERRMQRCSMQEDYVDGCCLDCWETYLYWVANGRAGDPYHCDRLHEGGMIG